jgi:hypothetical protein
MKNWKILTFVSVAAIVAALLASSAFAAAMMGSGGYGGYGGMMGGGYGTGYGSNSPPYTTGATIPTTPSSQYYQPVYPMMFGGGMMGQFGNGQGFGGMMSGYGYAAPYANTGNPLTIANAVTIAQNYVSSIGNSNLKVKQVEEYSANFYVQVNEKNGNGAFELLINKYTGSIYPEMGPNMMWNTKYGMMRGGALGGIFGTPTTTMTVTSTQATANAQQYLNTYVSGATTGDVTTFYGYYTIEVLNGGTTYGMLSVNGYTGQVWVHTWHGTFVQEQQVS